jgi:hypothetical protein
MPEAVTTTGAPSAGAESMTGTATAASPTAVTSQLTDEQILDGVADAGGDAQLASPEAETAGAGEEPRQTTQGERQESNESRSESEAGQGRLAPEVRDFFKTHPEVRDAWYRAQEYQRLFPDFKTAELVADQLRQYENPQELAANLRGAADLQAIDRMYFSGDPVQHGQIVENLMHGDPEAFGRLVETLPETLRRLASDPTRPELARRAEQMYVESQTRAFERVLEWQQRKARADGNEELARELERVAEATLGRRTQGAGRVEEKLARLEAEQQRLADQKRQSQAEAAARWVSEANEQVVDEFTGAVRETVEQLVGRTYPDEAKRLLVGEIYRRVNQRLQQNQDLTDHVKALTRGGAGDPRTQRQMIRLVTNQAKRLIPDVAERVIGAFGQGTLAATEQKRRQETAAAGRVDVTGTAGMDARGTQAPTPGQLKQTGKYRRLSDDDILEGRL